jgi:hypothetical protein
LLAKLLTRIFPILAGRCGARQRTTRLRKSCRTVAALISGKWGFPVAQIWGGDAAPPCRRSRPAGASPDRCRENVLQQTKRVRLVHLRTYSGQSIYTMLPFPLKVSQPPFYTMMTLLEQETQRPARGVRTRRRIDHGRRVCSGKFIVASSNLGLIKATQGILFIFMLQTTLPPPIPSRRLRFSGQGQVFSALRSNALLSLFQTIGNKRVAERPFPPHSQWGHAARPHPSHQIAPNRTTFFRIFLDCLPGALQTAAAQILSPPHLIADCLARSVGVQSPAI